MALNFQQVPDWISFENQGGNIAVADLDSDGIPELIVLRVDHPTPGQNGGFYRVGRRLDAQVKNRTCTTTTKGDISNVR